MASTFFAMVPAFSGDAKTALLWPQGAPGSKGDAPADKPDITIHLPAPGTANGSAVLICPGGGYGCLCSSYEGHDIANWLNGYGIAGIVLKYRLNPYRHPIPLQDAQRAMRLIRLNANEWGIDKDRIGVMGFSAGGHLASTLGTHFDSGDPASTDPAGVFGCRPDFMILVYPVISMGLKAHVGSVHNLLGPNPTQEERDYVSNELQVTSSTPPAFIAHSVKDSVVSVENSRVFYAALKAKGIPAEYFELTKGDHGLGCGKSPEWESWQAECVKWLKSNKIATEK